MPPVQSTMLPLATELPDFTLRNVIDERTVRSIPAENAQGTLVMFLCNHCPFVVHVMDKVIEVANDAVERGIFVLAINSNSVRTHPQDGPGPMAKLARTKGFRFPFLFDETQDVARTFQAACTPEFYLFDANRSLVYRGRFDDASPGNKNPVTGADLKAAIDALLANCQPASEQHPSIGCSIKWH